MFVNPGRELPLSILANILKLETQAQWALGSALMFPTMLICPLSISSKSLKLLEVPQISFVFLQFEFTEKEVWFKGFREGHPNQINSQPLWCVFIL